MISFPQWLKTEGKEPKEEAGIKRDAMRLAIIQKLGCLYYENTSHGPLQQINTKEKGIPSHSGTISQDTICCSVGTDHTA